jgi:hypothetical protein
MVGVPSNAREKIEVKKLLYILSACIFGISVVQADTVVSFDNLNDSDGVANEVTATVGGVAIGTTVDGDFQVERSVENSADTGTVNDYLYAVTYSGADYDGDGTNDTLTYTVRVSGMAGNTVTKSVSGAEASGTGTVALDGSDADVTLHDTTDESWAVGSMNNGDTLIFTVEHLSVDAAGYKVKLDGFTAAELFENTSFGHTAVFGVGDDLFARDFNNNYSYSTDAVDTLYVSAQNRNSAGWGVSDLDYSMTVYESTGNEVPVADAQSLSTTPNTPLEITLTGSDLDGPSNLTYSVVSSTTNGVLTGTEPNLTYTPTNGYQGPDSFTFVANDGLTNSAPATVSISVFNVAPTATAQSVSTLPDTSLEITLTGSDPDSGPSNLTYSVVSQPTNGALSGATNVWIYTPTNGYRGPDSFTFIANDGLSNSAPATVSISVTNIFPTATAQSVDVYRNSSANITLTAINTDGPSNLTYSVVSQPINGTLSGSAPDLTYTPTSGYLGADSFTFEVSDGLDDSEEVATVSITVNNAPPVADSKTVLAQPDQAVTIVLSGTDPDAAPSNLIYRVTSQPANGFLSGTEPNLTYTSTNGFIGTDSFTYTANDGAVDSAEATVSILVSDAGWDFSFTDFSAALFGNTLSVNGSSENLLVAGVATNDDDYVYSVTYTAADYDGDGANDTLGFDVRVKGWSGSITDVPWETPDTSANTASATIGTNDAAVSVGAIFSVGGNMANGQTLEFMLENIDLSLTDASFASSVNSTGFTYAWLKETGGNSHQAVIGSGTGLLGYDFNASVTAGPFSVGTGSLYISADNAESGSLMSAWGVADVDFGINVIVWDSSVNQVPKVDAQSVTASINTPTDITLTGSDVDSGPSNLTFAVASQPTNGTVVLEGDVATYTPINGYLGADSFTFTANDGATNSESATVSITVINVVPVADDQDLSMLPATALDITLSCTDTDGPSNLTYTVLSWPVNGTLVTNGALPDMTYTPTGGFEGADSFTFLVNDGLTNSEPATISITVENTAPVADGQSVSTPYETALAITLTGSDVDGPSNLTFTVASQPANGTLATNGALPNLTYTPNSGYVGADSFTFTVNDGMDDSAPATISITVEEPSAVEDPVIRASVSSGSLSLSWDGDGTYNVLTNANLLNAEGWGIAVSNAVSPVTNAIGSESQLFFKLSE